MRRESESLGRFCIFLKNLKCACCVLLSVFLPSCAAMCCIVVLGEGKGKEKGNERGVYYLLFFLFLFCCHFLFFSVWERIMTEKEFWDGLELEEVWCCCVEFRMEKGRRKRRLS